MARDDVVDVEHRGTAVQGLSTEYTAECTIVLFPDFGDNGVHRPSIELVVGQDFEWHVVLLLVPFYGLHGIATESSRVGERGGKNTSSESSL